MPSLPEVLAAIAEYVGDDADAQKRITELKRELRKSGTEHAEQLNAVAQSLIDVGIGKKKGESDTKAAEKDAEIERLKGELENAQEAAESAQKKPNEIQADFDKRREKLEAKALKLENDLKAERDGRTQDRVTYAASPVMLHLQGQVDPGYLDEVIGPRVQRRIRAQAAGTGVDYLDEHETPYDGDEKQAAKALAEDTLKAIPDLYRLRQMNAGGGSGSGSGMQAVTVDALEQEKLRRREYTSL